MVILGLVWIGPMVILGGGGGAMYRFGGNIGGRLVYGLW